jgi:hypothetical protein
VSQTHSTRFRHFSVSNNRGRRDETDDRGGVLASRLFLALAAFLLRVPAPRQLIYSEPLRFSCDLRPAEDRRLPIHQRRRSGAELDLRSSRHNTRPRLRSFPAEKEAWKDRRATIQSRRPLRSFWAEDCYSIIITVYCAFGPNSQGSNNGVFPRSKPFSPSKVPAGCCSMEYWRRPSPWEYSRHC